MTTATVAPIVMKSTCGFCNTGDHGACATLIQHHEKVWRCGCTCPRAAENKCTACGNRNQDEVSVNRCINRDDCDTQSRVKTARLIAAMGIDAESLPAVRVTEEKAAKVAKTKEAKAPKPCQCECGGMTGGGKFIPGHDMKRASALKNAIKAGGPEADVAYAEMVQRGWTSKIPTEFLRETVA